MALAAAACALAAWLAGPEFGAQAGDLPFTGLLLWLVALLGALALAIGTRGRQLTAA